MSLWTQDPRDALRAGPDFDLSTFDRGSTPGWDGKKADAQAYTATQSDLLEELQERLYAHGRAGGKRKVLIVVQGLDTAGKGGIARHVLALFDPQGLALHSFGVPTEEELSHHFLWRIEKALPTPGMIGLFDRSHYEDVLVARVDNLVPKDVWRGRYDEINAWEKGVIDDDTIVLKFALMVSYEEQGLRLMERIDRPDKRWKWSSGDIATRKKWDAFQAAYSDVFQLTSTDEAPWYVLPADRKWYSRLAVTEILLRTLIEMDLRWPTPRWQPAVQRRSLAATMSDAALRESLATTEETLRKALEKSLDVNEEAARLRTAHATQEERDQALANIKAKRAELEADLEATLEHKQQLVGSTSSEPDEKPAKSAKTGKNKTGKKPSKPAKRKKKKKK